MFIQSLYAQSENVTASNILLIGDALKSQAAQKKIISVENVEKNVLMWTIYFTLARASARDLSRVCVKRSSGVQTAVQYYRGTYRGRKHCRKMHFRREIAGRKQSLIARALIYVYVYTHTHIIYTRSLRRGEACMRATGTKGEKRRRRRRRRRSKPAKFLSRCRARK